MEIQTLLDGILNDVGPTGLNPYNRFVNFYPGKEIPILHADCIQGILDDFNWAVQDDRPRAILDRVMQADS